MLSRRSLLKYFGISAAVLVAPKPLSAMENVSSEMTFNFRRFDKWLVNVSRGVQEKRLTSFRILTNGGTINVIGTETLNIIAMLDTVSLEYLKKNKKIKISKKEIDALSTSEVCFQIESKLVPQDFLEQLKNKHGRLTLSSWLVEGKFDRKSRVSEFVEVVKKKMEDKGIYINVKSLKSQKHELYTPYRWHGREHWNEKS